MPYPKKEFHLQKLSDLLMRAQMSDIPGILIAEFLHDAFLRSDFVYTWPDDIFGPLVENEIKEKKNEPS